MLLSILNSGILSIDDPSAKFLQLFLLFLSYTALILVMMPVHEFAHALTATKLGDPTPRWNGRLSLNPFQHLDVIGTVMILVCGIGYAKPVPVNPRYFKNPRGGFALTALMGPLSNLLLAVLSIGLFALINAVTGSHAAIVQNQFMFAPGHEYIYYVYLVFVGVFASVNIGLAVFNLLPIPPLDGSRIWGLILPERFVNTMERYSMFISIAIMGLLLTGILNTPLNWLRAIIGNAIGWLFGFPNLF